MGLNEDVAAASERAAIVSYEMFLMNLVASIPSGVPGGSRDRQIAQADQFAADIRSLDNALSDPKVSGALSLANPYPIDVAGIVRKSYAAAVLVVADNICRELYDAAYAEVEDLSPIYSKYKVPQDVSLHCEKEYERAIGECLPEANARAINDRTQAMNIAQSRNLAPPCPKCGSKNVF